METVDGDGYDEVAPHAASMIESMRAYGYTLATAAADLIDNSIAAGSTTVWVDTWWSGADSWIAITDDGHGMSETELRNAMRLGSRSPLSDREVTDLGRFGLGLKTASLSQCRRLTVISQQRPDSRHVRRWDLDHLSAQGVSGWQLLRTMHPASKATTARLDSLQTGTTVLWEVLDRVVQSSSKNDERIRSHFLECVAEVEQHLSMVFHRYLAGPRKRLTIFMDGHEVPAWDPFIEAHPATTTTPEERIELPEHDTSITVRGFVLPHKDRLTDQEDSRAAGPAGWSAQQGFYLYRNERLIVAGGWLGLGAPRSWRREEHYKLARIRLDVPNSMDHLWHLDVKKSHATPPPLVRDRLVGLAQTIRQSARQVFAHRGRYGKRTAKVEHARPWKALHQAGRTVYRIDRNHPLVAAVLGMLAPQLRQATEVMLRVIEETVPVQQIWLDAAENPQDTSPPFLGANARERRTNLTVAYAAIRRNRGLDHEATLAVLRGCEEFADDESLAIIGSLGEDLAT